MNPTTDTTNTTTNSGALNASDNPSSTQESQTFNKERLAELARKGVTNVRDGLSTAGRTSVDFAKRNPYWVAAVGAVAAGALAYIFLSRNRRADSDYAND